MKWRLGVVGSPIEHSLSPQLHEAGLKIAGLKGSSTRVELRESDAKKLAKWMGKDYDALSVTIRAATPPTATVAPVRLDPAIVTCVPPESGPVVGVSAKSTGAAM